MEPSEIRGPIRRIPIPDCAEPVIGRAFARPVGSIRATAAGSSFSNRKFVEPDQSDLPAMANQIRTLGLRQIDPTGKSLLIFRNRVKPRNQKYFCFRSTQISSLIRAVPSHKRGGSRSSRTRGGMRWTLAARETSAACRRTAKSCRSDAPMLASSLR